MLLGIVLHAALFLVPDAPWYVRDEKASWDLPYAAIVGAIHGFRMLVFFLISGFFTAMLWQRRGLRGLLKQRLLRVGLPLLAGCVTIIALTVWLGLFVVPGLDLAAVSPEGTPPVAMGVWLWLSSWSRDFHHLWFLWHLLWLVGLFALLARLGLKFTHPWAWWSLA